MAAATPTITMQRTSAVASEASPPGSLFSPLVDFLCLGGGSLLLVTLIAGLQRFVDLRGEIIVASALLAHFVNNPHFANSYQLFYSKFRDKVASERYSRELRVRYAIAGIGVPIVIVSFILYCIRAEDAMLLGKAANAMTFLVGWHYVKQGYGILMVTSVLKKAFFSAWEKRIALLNAYCCWSCFWLATNRSLAERDLWDIRYYLFDVPHWALAASLSVCTVTSIATVWMFARKWHAEKRSLALNGVVAYLTTLYAWLLLLLDPLYVFVIPACHSMQYLLVVWRYRLNLEDGWERKEAPFGALMDQKKWRLALFLGIGILLGYLGFWHLPGLMDGHIHYDHQRFGFNLFLFSFWIFINIHHYVMDNVMWRRGNPDTAKYLFAHQLGKA